MQTFCDKATGLFAICRQFVAYCLHLRRIQGAHILAGVIDIPRVEISMYSSKKAGNYLLSVGPVLAPVCVWHKRDMCVFRTAVASRQIELVRTDVDEADDVAVVGVVERDDLPRAGVDAGHAQGQVVGLRARVDEEDDAEFLGKRGDEALGVQDQVVVQEPVVCVEDRHLLLPCRGGMASSEFRFRR